GNQKRLVGAEFELKSANGETYTLITDENGEAVQSDVAFGTYTLTETKAPKGYEKLTEPLAVKVEKNAENNVVVLTIDNEKTPEKEEKGTLKLIKQDKGNQKRLANAEFELKSANGETYTLITDENGEADQSDLAFGTYTLTETKAPEGYEKLTEPLTVKVEKNAEDNVVVLTIDNEKTPEKEEKGTLKLIKQDKENQKRLAGAEFELKSANGETYTLITDENGEAAQSDLAFGTYTLTETKAPKGYEKLTEPLEVKVEKNAEGNVVVLTVDNEKTPTKPTDPTDPTDPTEKPDKPTNKPNTSTNNDKNKLPQTSESQGLTKALTAIGVIVIIGIVVFYAKQRKK
ncbi:MSCRAMM family protein, partial [Vagococcus lutrae]|uniref:MSCRAMM family protein n=1 Tax=Vagococcus lutrae TaxID=81947 RepID=UPI002351CA08